MKTRITTIFALILLFASASCESATSGNPNAETGERPPVPLTAGPASVSTSSSYRLSGGIGSVPAQQTSASFRLSPVVTSAD